MTRGTTYLGWRTAIDFGGNVSSAYLSENKTKTTDNATKTFGCVATLRSVVHETSDPPIA